MISGVYGRHSLTDISTIGDGRFSFFPSALPKGLTQGEEGKVTPMTTIEILPSRTSIYTSTNNVGVYMVDAPSLIFRPLVMVALLFLPVHYQKVYHEKEEEERPPRQQSGFFSHIWSNEPQQTESQPVTYMEQWHKKWPMFCWNVN